MNKIFVVGIGPGDSKFLTFEANDAINEAEVVVGYSVYVELLKEYFPDKTYMSTPMTKEKDRCVLAFELANEGRTVALVCSGDAGVYGMSGLIYEISPDYMDTEIVIVSGISACISGACVLGAPLIHDFAVISLSDRLTSWTLIEKRLKNSAECDLVIVLYNPSSKGRPDYLRRACDILLKEKSENTVCGIVRNIGRAGQEERILSLKELRDTSVDMFTTVFIGNSSTRVINDKMVTPRGYK